MGRTDVVPKLVLPGKPLKEAIELDVPRAEARTIVLPAERSNLDDLPLAHQLAKRPVRFARAPQVFEHCFAALSGHDEASWNDDVRGKFLECSKVKAKRLLDEVALLQPMLV
jgi:hypothetical protein